jgi:hypothetical protein
MEAKSIYTSKNITKKQVFCHPKVNHEKNLPCKKCLGTVRKKGL